MKYDPLTSAICRIGIMLRLALSIFFCTTKIEAIEPSDRISVALLPFEDQTKDPKAAHWRHSIPRAIGIPLSHVKAVRVGASEAAEYGLRRCNISAGHSIQVDQAKMIGEIIESRRIVWGHYNRKGKTWTATARVMVVATGETSPPLTASSDDWLTLTQELAHKVLTVLEITPTEEQKQKMKGRMTDSAQALESYSLSYSIMTDQRPLNEMVAMLEKTLEFDPQFTEAIIGYARCLLMQGKVQEGRVQLEKALKIKPESDTALLTLGLFYSFDENAEKASKYLRDACRYGPDDPDNFIRMAEYYMMSKEYDKAIENLQVALLLNPVSAQAHAQLGFIYVMMGQKQQALRSLQDAVMINPEDVAVYQVTARAYDGLGMTSLAIEHREKLLLLGKKTGFNPEWLEPFEVRLKELRDSLTPQNVVAEEPRRYTDEQLRKELRDQLTEEEFSQLIFPLESTDEMKKWALELTKNVQGDMPKARAIFDALSARHNPKAGGYLNARQVYENWKKPDVSFQCQEYARLYVALARSVGLNVYFTRVDIDNNQEVVLHACAAVFIDGKVFLVDPSYRWFGIPHQKFSVSNDMQAVVLQMNQIDSLVAKRIAAKLQPDDLSLFNLGGALTEAGHNDEARQAWEEFFKLDVDTWMASYARGAIAFSEKKWDVAEKELKQSIGIHSKEPSSHFHLGLVYMEKKLYAEAREAFRSCLRVRPAAKIETKCRTLIAYINENLSNASPLQAKTKLEQWQDALLMKTQVNFLFFEWSPMIRADLGLIYDTSPEALAVEMAALHQQAEREPNNYHCRLRLGVLLQISMQAKESAIAMADAQRVARLILKNKPEDIDASYVLVCNLHGNEEAGRVARQAVETYPQDWRSWMCLAYYQSEAFMRELFRGLNHLPAQGYDLTRAVEAMSLRSNSLTECVKLLKMLEESLANAEKAVEISKDSNQALIQYLGFRTGFVAYRTSLQKICSLTVDDPRTEVQINLALLARVIQASQNQPEILAALSLIQMNAIAAVARFEKGTAFDAAAVHKTNQAAVEPTMKRLLELSQDLDPVAAAVALEGYAAVLMSQKGAGAEVNPPFNLAERLELSLASAPRRLLLWDIRIVNEAIKDIVDRSQIVKCHEIALRRSKQFPTARGFAILAATSTTPDDERKHWEKAATMEPTQLFYSLNLVAAKIRADHTEKNLADALTRIQEIGDQGYETGYWQRYPQHHQYRMRLFVIQQALSGKTEVARSTIDKMLKTSPTDPQMMSLKDLVDHKPE